jgi:hypothetical protein
VLDPESEDLVRAYRLFFSTPDGMAVLVDLMKFCRFRRDAETQIDEGMRRVFLHILNFSQLSDEQLIALYAGRKFNTTEPQNE